jgi:uridine kinase
MAQWTPLKRDTLDSLADEFLHNYSKGRTLLAVDGVAGTTTFADSLAERLGRGGHAVFRASIGDFLRPRAARGADTAESRYSTAFDYDLFRRVLVDPFKLGGSAGFVTAAFDAERDQPYESDWKTGPQDATLVVDGPFLNRPELRGLWNWSLWLEAADEAAGMAEPYLATADPRRRATAIVDNTDPDHPRRVFADSC